MVDADRHLGQRQAQRARARRCPRGPRQAPSRLTFGATLRKPGAPMTYRRNVPRSAADFLDSFPRLIRRRTLQLIAGCFSPSELDLMPALSPRIIGEQSVGVGATALRSTSFPQQRGRRWPPTVRSLRRPVSGARSRLRQRIRRRIRRPESWRRRRGTGPWRTDTSHLSQYRVSVTNFEPICPSVSRDDHGPVRSH